MCHAVITNVAWHFCVSEAAFLLCDILCRLGATHVAKY